MSTLELPVGLATSVGPLPHTDPVAAARFVLSLQPRLPAVPSLPNRSLTERRITQAAWGVPGLRVLADGSLETDPARLDVEVDLGVDCLSGEPFTSLRAFVAAIVDRRAPAKFQLTGPVSLGVALLAVGIPIGVAFRLARRVVTQRAAALVELLNAEAPGVEPVVIVDEPSLGVCTDAAFPLQVDDAVDAVSGTLALLQARGCLAGLRCGPGSDWAVVLATGPQLLTLPASDDVVDHAGLLGQFLDGGGRVIWGAVPTDGPVGTGVDRLWRNLAGLWCALVRAGIDPTQLRSQALLSPAAGLGRHHVSQAELTLRMVDALAKRLYDQATGLRLSVGA
ncbi:MAG: hypothetical protein OEY23_25735 [Acidimicrobiia bacterium]|nr:hypothetical protein [Acidimicrobiia bacterium]